MSYDGRRLLLGIGLRGADLMLAAKLSGDRMPDKIIAPDGNPYIYRWEIAKTQEAGAYFHIQVASDTDRAIHDHPWDNVSCILAGCYEELFTADPAKVDAPLQRRVLLPGMMVARRNSEAHRLILPRGVPYCMTLFTMGPRIREWGFWFDVTGQPIRKFRPWDDVTVFDEKTRASVMKEPNDAEQG